jgi:raffinose/stachyose/melibiose transport system substrate-binding protein
MEEKMKALKKFICVLNLALTMVLALGIFTGCNRSSQPEKAEAKKKELRWMNIVSQGSPSYQLYVDAVNAFNAGNDKYEIVSDTPNDLGTKLMVEYSAGTGADIAWSLTIFSKKLMDANLIIDWQDVYALPENADITQWFSKEVRSYSDFGDGRLMMLPNEASIDGLYYNIDMFKEYGWKLPETWDDLIKLAATVREQGKYLLSVGGASDPRFAWLATALISRTAGVDAVNHLTFGEGLQDWDKPEYGFPQALQKFKELVDAGAYYPGTLGMSTSEADQLFCSEQVAMYYEGAWKVGNFSDIGGASFLKKVGVTAFPTMPDMNGDNACVGGTLNGWIINANLNAEDRQACVDFLKTIVSPDFYKGIVETGSMLYTGQLDYDRTKTPEPTNVLQERFLNAPSMVASIDCTLDTAMQDAIIRSAFPGILGKTMTVDEAVKLVANTGREVYNDLYAK